MKLPRLLRHLFAGTLTLSNALPQAALKRLEEKTADLEKTHSGEVRFAVEAGLSCEELLRGVSARERALEMFAQQHIWDTEHNNGVLIYLLLADRNIEIVADRGIDRLVGKPRWEEICREMEKMLSAGKLEAGIVLGLELISNEMARHFPAQADDQNELSNAPIVL